MRKEGKEYVAVAAACNQFQRSSGEKSTRLDMVALTVGPFHTRMRASKEQASKGSVCGRAIAATCKKFQISRGERSTRLGIGALTIGSVRTCG